MYAAHFGLKREPFSLAPDPRFLFMSERHREALAHLLYGVRGGGGFVLLTGEIGAGKTTVVRCLLGQLPAHCVVAYVFNPKLTTLELLQTVCHEFGITDVQGAISGKAHVDALNRFLLKAHAQGKQALLVIDEAQALDAAVLEQLRLLTNLETTERKLLQIVLVGQPELRDMLAQPGLEQLAQRVIARYHLGALDAPDTRRYLRHRLAVAGARGAMPFDEAAVAQIHRDSGGVPRRINLLADRALLGAYSAQRAKADRAIVRRAADEIAAREPRRPGALALPPWAWAAAVLLLAVGGGGGWWWSQRGGDGPAPVAAASPTQAPASASSPPAAAAAPVPVPVPAPAPAPVVRTDEPAALLAAAIADEPTAWRELGLRWNVAIGDGDPCAAVQKAQLACFRASAGGLQLLRQLDRPAVLVLRQPGGARGHALLVALSDSHATLQVGARRFVLTLPSLVGSWRGEFHTLWRTPPGWRSGVPLDANGTSRTWVQQQLAAALPEAPPGSLAERITAFQVLAGVPVDGSAGPVTLMLLNRSAGVEEPRLPAGNL
jgi:general secretion pathway protein A